MSWYPIQHNLDFIGSSSTPNTLTTSFSGNTKTFETGGLTEVVLYVQYNANAGTNILHIKIDRSPDGVNFYQQISESYSSGTATVNQLEHQFTAGSGATYQYSIPINIAGSYIRISAKETVNSGSAGSIWISAEASGK